MTGRKKIPVRQVCQVNFASYFARDSISQSRL